MYVSILSGYNSGFFVHFDWIKCGIFVEKSVKKSIVKICILSFVRSNSANKKDGNELVESVSVCVIVCEYQCVKCVMLYVSENQKKLIIILITSPWIWNRLFALVYVEKIRQKVEEFEPVREGNRKKKIRNKRNTNIIICANSKQQSLATNQFIFIIACDIRSQN